MITYRGGSGKRYFVLHAGHFICEKPIKVIVVLDSGGSAFVHCGQVYVSSVTIKSLLEVNERRVVSGGIDSQDDSNNLTFPI